MPLKLWLRDEYKETEKRTALTPKDASSLISAGAHITVEESINRIFPIEDYKRVGCKITNSKSFYDAPKDYFILGLKELPVNQETKYQHKHIYFAHSYKGQDNAKVTIDSFKKASGTLFDLEYLTLNNGRRIAAFGRWAGFVGQALALEKYYHNQIDDHHFPPLSPFLNQEEFIAQIINKKEKAQKHPSILVIGAGGRCGQGAVDAAKLCGLQVTKWDRKETISGGPFKEILDHDIFVNCALVTKKIPPFIDENILNTHPSKNLSLIADVGCDPTSELNPVSIYKKCTTWDRPFLKDEKYNLEILSVDNLPSLLPKESSEDFSEQLTPYLMMLHTQEQLPEVWSNALNVFKNHL